MFLFKPAFATLFDHKITEKIRDYANIIAKLNGAKFFKDAFCSLPRGIKINFVISWFILNFVANVKINTMIRFIYRILPIVFLVVLASCDSDEPKPEPQPMVAGRTILVYQVANNNLGTSNYNEDDIEEMCQGANAGKIGKNGRLLVYNAGPYANPMLLEIKQNAVDTLLIYDRNNLSVSSTRMLQVIKDTKSIAPADDYGIVLWSHGDGWFQDGIEDVYDEKSRTFGYEGSTKKMNITTLANVLDGQNFSFVYFDCCYMASIETVYQLRGVTPYIVGSATELHVCGMPYHLNLEPLFADGEADLITAARNTYEYYDAQVGENRTNTMAVIKTSALDKLASATRAVYEKATTTFPEGYIPQRFSYTSIKQCVYFDFYDYVSALCYDEDGNARFEGAESLFSDFDTAFYDVVLYKAETPLLWDALSLSKHHGLSTYILRSANDITNKNYNTLSWYSDVASYLPINNQ